MIYEMRTYDLKPKSLPEVEKRFGEAYEKRRKYSELGAFWHSEIGPLNQIVHVWPYKDLAERGSGSIQQSQSATSTLQQRQASLQSANASVVAAQKQIGISSQEQFFQDVPYIPLGQYLSDTAYRRGLTDVRRGIVLPLNVRRV